MNRPSLAALFFAAILSLGCAAASAEPILYEFTGLPGDVHTCVWFNDNITDRSIPALTEQTDLLYNRVALPAGENVAIGGTATSAQGEAMVDFHLGRRLICTAAAAIYGPTPAPSEQP
jgi:hypothetical protein